MSTTAHNDISERVQDTRRRNREALSGSREHAAERRREVERSKLIVSRAVERLRRAGVLR